MELNMFFYVSFFLFLGSLVLLPFFILFYRQVSPFIATNLPPGRIGYPVIGESLALSSSGQKGQPEIFFNKRITKYSSQVFKTSLFLQPTVVFCGPECHKFLFSNENKLVKSWWPKTVDKIFPTSLHSTSSQESMRMRRMLPQFLGPRALQRYICIMDSVAQRYFASHWENKTQVTVFPLTQRYTFTLACCLFMGIEDPNQIEKLMQPFEVMGRGIISLPIDLPGTPVNRAIKASKFIKEELRNIIKQRKVDIGDGKVSPTQDILSHMLSTCDEDGQYLNESSILDKILGLMIGGFDTASSVCASLVKFLAEFPHIYQQIYNEQMEIAKSKSPGEMLNWNDVEKMKYSWNVACEVLRFFPPLQGSFREAISDFVFNGFSIPKGWKLYWSACSTHKNPTYFPDPEKFDPSRFDGDSLAPYTFVPFGGGPRMCPGKEYARMEILVFIHNLVKRFRWEKVIQDEKIVINPLPIPTKGLPIYLYPH